VAELARQVQEVTGQTVKVAFADQGYTGEEAAQAARDEGIELQVIKLAEAKKGFVLLSRRWVVERSFGWLNRFRRLARDYERLPERGCPEFCVNGLRFNPALAALRTGS
jgi:transposase